MNKPREFWIYEGKANCDGLRFVYSSEQSIKDNFPDNWNGFHVIEYSAYEKLLAENEALKKNNDELKMKFKLETRDRLAKVKQKLIDEGNKPIDFIAIDALMDYFDLINKYETLEKQNERYKKALNDLILKVEQYAESGCIDAYITEKESKDNLCLSTVIDDAIKYLEGK